MGLRLATSLPALSTSATTCQGRPGRDPCAHLRTGTHRTSSCSRCARVLRVGQLLPASTVVPCARARNIHRTVALAAAIVRLLSAATVAPTRIASLRSRLPANAMRAAGLATKTSLSSAGRLAQGAGSASGGRSTAIAAATPPAPASRAAIGAAITTLACGRSPTSRLSAARPSSSARVPSERPLASVLASSLEPVAPVSAGEAESARILPAPLAKKKKKECEDLEHLPHLLLVDELERHACAGRANVGDQLSAGPQ